VREFIELSPKGTVVSLLGRLRHLPPRLATGAFVLNAGLQKWSGDEQTAATTHGFASGAFPILKPIEPAKFLRLLAGAEIGLGAALLLPIVPTVVAGTALTAFSSGLLGLYLRTPGLHKAGSIRPTQQGTPIAKDVWMLGIGLGLLADALAERARRR